MRVLAILCCAAGCCWGNACTTAATATPGNWSDAGIWSSCGGVTPGIGDTAVIQRPVTMDVDTTVGTSPADTISTITGPVIQVLKNSSTTYGDLDIAAGITWTMRGSVLLTSANTYHATVTMEAGSTLIFDASAAADPTVTIYRIYLDGWHPGVVINGTSGARVTVRGKPVSCGNCANSLAFDVRNLNATVKYDAQYVDYYDLGCATCNAGGPKAAIGHVQYYGDANGLPQAIFRIQHATFTRTAGTRRESYQSTSVGAGTWVLNDVRSYSSLTSFLSINPQADLTTGTRSITNCYFDTGLDTTYASLRGFTVDHTVFDGQGNILGGVVPATSWTNNVMRYVSVGGGGNHNPAGTQGNTFVYVESAGTPGNSQGFGFTGNGAASIQVSGLIYEYGPGANTEGTVASIDNSATRVDLDRAIILPTAQNKTVPSGDFNVGNGPYRLTHNLITVGTFIAGSAYYGEQAAGQADRVDTVKSNIFWDPNGTDRGNGLTAAVNRSTVVANHFSPAGVTNNTNWHYATVSYWVVGNNAACNPCTSNGTPYDIATTGTTPGANDVNVDPQFVWQKEAITAPGIREWANTRQGATYDTACGGVYTGCATAQNAFAVFGSGDLTAKIDDLFAWLRAKWAPTNVALKNAGHDGTDVGPVAGMFGVPTLTPILW